MVYLFWELCLYVQYMTDNFKSGYDTVVVSNKCFYMFYTGFDIRKTSVFLGLTQG